jgi:hypothetical protein
VFGKIEEEFEQIWPSTNVEGSLLGFFVIWAFADPVVFITGVAYCERAFG